MSSKLKILFRVDANQDIGWGHVKRCQSLAVECRKHGHDVLFAGNIDNVTATLLAGSKIDHESMKTDPQSHDDFDVFLGICEKFNTDIVVVDTYVIGTQCVQRIVDKGYFVVSIHDLGMDLMPAHVLINTNINAEKIQDEVHKKTISLLGTKYLMMPQEYKEFEFQNEGLEEVRDILITMGSADPNDLTTKILKILDAMQEDFRITVIIGPHYDNVDKIAEQIKCMVKKVRTVEAPASLFPYIRDCSIAVSGAGQTLYQLALFGRPTIGIAQAGNQQGHLKELSDLQALIGINFEKKEDFDQQIKDQMTRLIREPSYRTQIAKTATKLVDGRGTQRAFDEIINAFQNRKMVSLQN